MLVAAILLLFTILAHAALAGLLFRHGREGAVAILAVCLILDVGIAFLAGHGIGRAGLRAWWRLSWRQARRQSAEVAAAGVLVLAVAGGWRVAGPAGAILLGAAAIVLLALLGGRSKGRNGDRE